MIEAPFEVGRMLGRLNDADLPYVVVGGIAVIVHGYVRPTDDLDVLVDFIPEGSPPLDFEGVLETARAVEIDGVETRVCDLGHLTAFKRLAGRMRDRADLEELEAAHGPLPEVR